MLAAEVFQRGERVKSSTNRQDMMDLQDKIAGGQRQLWPQKFVLRRLVQFLSVFLNENTPVRYIAV
ncbi:hypothetical protein D1159_05180 [Pseudoflavonifractor sp. 524-17]|nr:hypothetical protein [Pseudoflavonifractor sp. 524-17]